MTPFLHKMPKEDKEFESFMERVDIIGSIIKGLSSDDKAVSEKAAREAKLCLEGRIKGKINENDCLIKHDRTIINKSAFDAETLDQTSTPKEAFMAMMSKDADERAKSKREREGRAKKLMQDAEKYKQGTDYEAALYLYTKAIDENVNWPKLFVERAKILSKLKLMKRAMEDCDKAMKLNEDLLFLKGDLATREDKAEADQLSNDIKCIKEELLSFHEHEY